MNDLEKLGGSIVSAGILVLAAFGLLMIGDQADIREAIEGETKPTPIVVPAASGIEGFNVEQFCNDPLTKAQAFEVPDAGVTYQLTRVRDGKSETVRVVVNPSGVVLNEYATHYYDSAVGQQSEPAFVSKDALGCIEKKAQ